MTFAVAGADAPVTTSVIENTDSPVWDFQQQARYEVWTRTDVLTEPPGLTASG